MPPTRVPAGKPVSEIHGKWAAARNRPSAPVANGASAEESGNPVSATYDRIAEMREDMQRHRIQTAMTNTAQMEAELEQEELEARKLETQVKSLENRSRLQELKASLGEAGNNANNTMMFAMLEMLQDQINAKNAAPSPMDASAQMMMGELAEIRAEMRERLAGREHSEDALDTLSKQMQTLLTMRQMFAELAPPAQERSTIISAAERDLDTTIRMQEIQLNHERMMIELDLKKQQMAEEISIRRQQMENDRLRQQGLADGIKSLATTFQPVIQDMAQLAAGRMSQPAAGIAAVPDNVIPMAAPQAAAMAYAAPMTQMTGDGAYHQADPDLQAHQCGNCGFELQIDAGAAQVQCGNCGSTFDVDWSQ